MSQLLQELPRCSHTVSSIICCNMRNKNLKKCKYFTLYILLHITYRCTECVDALYCNMNCWEEACLSHHRWICLASQMGLLRQIGITHLALKLLCVCATTTNNEKFNDVQQLVTNFNKLTSEDAFSYGIVSYMIFKKMKCL